MIQDVRDKNAPWAVSSLECVVDKMLGSVMAGAGAAETVTAEELKSLIFSTPERDSFARTLQGRDAGGELQQSWLCSTNEVPSLVNRCASQDVLFHDLCCSGSVKYDL